MTHDEIIKEVDFILDNGFFKPDECLRVLRFRARLEDEGSPDKVVKTTEADMSKVQQKVGTKTAPAKTVKKEEIAEVKPKDDDNPF